MPDIICAANVTDNESARIPLLSIIMPVYNSEKHLAQALDSIFAQTYPNIEVVLVDDGSTDNSKKIYLAYLKQGRRLRVFRTSNFGAAAARNLGLQMASGTFIGFMDSDDWIAPSMYAYLYSLLSEYGADIAQVALQEASDNELLQPSELFEHSLLVPPEAAVLRQPEAEPTFSPELSPELTASLCDSKIVTVLEGDDILLNYLQGSNYSMQTRLYQRRLFSNFSFDAGHINEDIVASYSILRNARRIVCTSQAFYFYRVTSDGITHAALQERDLADLPRASKQLLELANNHSNVQVRELARLREQRSPFTLLLKMARYGAGKDIDEKAVSRKLKLQLRGSYIALLRSAMPLNRKVLLLLVRLSYPLTCRVARAHQVWQARQ